jgi:hypothetical protein
MPATITSRSLTAGPCIAADAVRHFFDAVRAADPGAVAAAMHPTKRASAGDWTAYGAHLKAAGFPIMVRTCLCMGSIIGPSLDLLFQVVQVSVDNSTYLITTRAVTDTEDRVCDVVPLF